jgi:hypothetical protein
LTVSATAKASSASKVHSLSGSVRCVASSAKPANAGHVSLAQRRVMTAIEICRTAALGGHVECCQDCAHTRVAYNSCRNKHCPKCQWRAAAAWLAAREGELLPVPYFHFVFKLPSAIGAMAYQNKAKVYGLLFKAAAETLTTIAADRKHLGAKIGVIAVLHTWGQNLQLNPHLHCVVPGGGISPDGKRWISSKPGFFLPYYLVIKAPCIERADVHIPSGVFGELPCRFCPEQGMRSG